MPEVAFVMSERQDPALRELAATVGYELERQSVPSALHLDGFPEPRADRVYVLLDPRSYLAHEGDRALPEATILKRTAFLCVERPPLGPDDPHVAILEQAGAVFAIDQRAELTLKRLDIPTRLLRPGYSASLDHFQPDADRPVDVVFLGNHTERRARHLAEMEQLLAHRNCVFHLSGDDSGTPFMGEDRWPLLGQTKVVLNLHCGAETRLEWRRVLDAIHAGAVVVSEHSSGIAPLVPGEHLLMASAESLAYVADALLGDEPRLARMRVAAYERLSSWIPFALPVSVLRAALVELVGEPLPAGA